MGFRSGAYATVWEVTPRSEKVTQVRISTSKRQAGSESYMQDFCEFCSCIGETTAKAARALQHGDRIKLGDIETTSNFYKKVNDVWEVLPKWEEGARKFVNYNIYSFEKASEKHGAAGRQAVEYEDPNIDNVDVVAENDEGFPF